ncbi:hypothetical protein AB0395_45645 [Streptosporangium sp. NPDC051023]|uniref:hypothetical protein n=1 Tax=Streptosporangium sp. NPDC051023 TaxID=3155410 RepID=UPI00344C55FD
MSALPDGLEPMDPLTWRTVVARCLLGSTVKLVAYTLANYASSDGSDVRPGEALLIKDTELGERTVRDALTKLREVGLIVRTFHASATGLRDKADEYRLTFPEDLESRVPMWDPKRRRITQGGEEMAPPAPKTRQKRTKAPATDAGGSEGAPPASPAGGPVENGSESVENPVGDAPENPLPGGNHRQLLPEPPATVTGTTGNSCPPPSHAPSQSPSQDSGFSPYGAEVEGETAERCEPSADLDYPTAFKIVNQVLSRIPAYTEAIRAKAAAKGRDSPRGEALTIAVARLVLADHPELTPERRTA